MIIHCGCTHQAQDELHGKGNRVHNPCHPKLKPAVFMRCTVCKSEKQVGKEKVAA